MSIEIQNPRKRDIAAATTVVSLLLTGSFILQRFGISPLLDRGYRLLGSGDSAPVFFGLAIGAAGVFTIIYHLVYVVFISPISCKRDHPGVWIGRPNFQRDFQFSDIISMVLITITYLYLLRSNNVPIDQTTLLGGMIIIITSGSLTIIPRMVANRIGDSCFFALKTILISVPLSILAYLPAIIIIEWRVV